jgi:hypothetical protein
MSQLITSVPTRAPAFRNLDQSHDYNDAHTGPSKMWALVEALAYASAFINPAGVLAPGPRLAGPR